MLDMEGFKKFLNEKQDLNAVRKIHGKVSELLTSEEEIEYIAVQKKPALNLSPDCIALTNKRIIFCRPKTLGLSMQFQDFLWKDIADCHIKEGILGATFYIKTTGKRVISMDYLPKAQARLLYRFAQQKEEEMAEFRRQRQLEHTRAAAGGGIIVNTSEGSNSKANEAKDDPMETLKRLKNMLENDIINQEEFNLKKEEILNRI